MMDRRLGQKVYQLERVLLHCLYGVRSCAWSLENVVILNAKNQRTSIWHCSQQIKSIHCSKNFQTKL